MKRRLQLESLEVRYSPASLDLSAAVPDARGAEGQHEVGHWMGLYHTAAESGISLAAPQEGPAPASFDAYLKLEGVAGESARASTHAGGGGGKVIMQDYHFVMRSSLGDTDLTDAPDDETEQSIAVGGYIRIKKLHSGG